MAGDFPRAYCHTCEEEVGNSGSMRKAHKSRDTHRSLEGLYHEVEIQSRPPSRESSNDTFEEGTE